MKNSLFFIILFLASFNSALAACQTNRSGEVICGLGPCAQDKEGDVYCSKYLHGDAVIDKYGHVICGKGQCLSSSDFNAFFCSSVDGGGASLNRFGIVKCYAGCEKASPSMCETVKGQE